MGPINAVDDINTNLIKEQNNGTAITYQQIASEYLKNLIYPKVAAWKWMRGDYRVVGVQVEQTTFHYDLSKKIQQSSQD